MRNFLYYLLFITVLYSCSNDYENNQTLEISVDIITNSPLEIKNTKKLADVLTPFQKNNTRVAITPYITRIDLGLSDEVKKEGVSLFDIFNTTPNFETESKLAKEYYEQGIVLSKDFSKKSLNSTTFAELINYLDSLRQSNGEQLLRIFLLESNSCAFLKDKEIFSVINLSANKDAYFDTLSTAKPLFAVLLYKFEASIDSLYKKEEMWKNTLEKSNRTIEKYKNMADSLEPRLKAEKKRLNEFENIISDLEKIVKEPNDKKRKEKAQEIVEEARSNIKELKAGRLVIQDNIKDLENQLARAKNEVSTYRNQAKVSQDSSTHYRSLIAELETRLKAEIVNSRARDKEYEILLKKYNKQSELVGILTLGKDEAEKRASNEEKKRMESEIEKILALVNKSTDYIDIESNKLQLTSYKKNGKQKETNLKNLEDWRIRYKKEIYPLKQAYQNAISVTKQFPESSILNKVLEMGAEKRRIYYRLVEESKAKEINYELKNFLLNLRPA